MFRRAKRRIFARGGFTLPELLVIIAIIAVLIAVLLPALASALRTGAMAKTQNNMRQIATWMTMYSTANRDHILPSQFNYQATAATGFPVKVRSDADLGLLRYKGTWTDILWTVNGLGTSYGLTDSANLANTDKYLFDSPDREAYESAGVFDDNPLRAAAPNSLDFNVGGAGNGVAKPFGDGALESGLPGYLAANNFFNASPDAPALPNGTPTPSLGRWYVTGQIKVPERSMYLVDSYAGETIDPEEFPYATDPAIDPPTIEVDFRYNGACLMLFLDGHMAPELRWDDLNDLQMNRHIKVQKLTQN